jgi:hypothetical protein
VKTADVDWRYECTILVGLLSLIEDEVSEIDAVSGLSNESFGENWDNPEDTVYDAL